MSKCKICQKPTFECKEIEHWKKYAYSLEEKLDMRDEDRDKFDVADWLEEYEKVRNYNCGGCGRHYELPTHLTHFTCICGHRCRMRHLGGTNPDEAVIDAAIAYFGTERMARLAYIAEIVAGKYAQDWSADRIRQEFRNEMDKWTLGKNGWTKK
jgi:hypothetical protein